MTLKAIRVGSKVVTQIKLRVLSGLMVPKGHITTVSSIIGTKAKIEYKRYLVWVNISDLKLE